MIIPRRALAPLMLLVALLTLTVGYVAGIGAAPSAFFGEDLIVLGPPGGALPGRGELSASLVPAMRAIPGVSAVSPEIFAVTVLDGKSMVARGAEIDAFLALERGALSQGRLPQRAGEALGGDRFLREFGLSVGDRIVVPAPTARLGAPFLIVGAFSAPGPAEDELVIRLEDARGLASVSPGAVHVVRVATSEPAALRALLDAQAPAFTYSDVRLSALAPVPGEPILMRANLTNWGIVSGTHVVAVRHDGAVVAELPVSVPARASVPVEVPFFLTDPGRANISINPTFDLEVREPTLRIEAAPRGVLQAPFAVRVVDAVGAPRAGVQVRVGSASATTDASGSAVVVPQQAGEVAILALVDGRTEGAARAFFTDAAHADVPYGVVERLVGPVEAIGNRSRVNLELRVVNQGGAEGDVTFDVLVDGAPATSVSRRLAPGARASISVQLEPLPAGNHTIAAGETGPSFPLRVYAGRDARAEQLLEAYQQAAAAGSATTQAEATAYIDELLGNVRLAVVALGIASGLLALLGTISVLARHIAERGPSVGALKAIGASDEHVLGIVSREAAILGAMATVGGFAAGVVLALALDATGFVRAFGHAVHPAYPWTLALLVLLLSVLGIVAVSRRIARGILDHSIDAMLRGAATRKGRDAPAELDAVLERA